MEANKCIVLGDEEVSMLPDGYVVSFVPFHERGLVVPPTISSRGCCTTTTSSCSTWTPMGSARCHLHRALRGYLGIEPYFKL
jgi:hypothetical protein